jgi:hypothetical protein
MCLFRKCQLQGLRSRQNQSLLIVNEDFGGERNAANGTLWTDTRVSEIKSPLWGDLGGLTNISLHRRPYSTSHYAMLIQQLYPQDN